jgi:O-antigen ligase
VSVLYLILNNSRNQVTNGDDTLINTSGRTDAWLFFYEKYLSNPIWGIGAGNSSKFVKNSDIEFFVTPHNEYLRLFLESGAVGAVLVIIFVVPEVFKNLKLSNFKKKNLFVFIISALYLNVLIFSFTDNTFATYQFYIPFLVLINLTGTRLQKT